MPGIRKTPNMSGSSRNEVGRSAHVNEGFLVMKPKIPMHGGYDGREHVNSHESLQIALGPSRW